MPWADAPEVGALLGLKTVLNEFIAYQALGEARISPGREFTRLLEVLPDACGSGAGMRANQRDTQQWLASLDHLIATHSDHAVWTARRIP